MAANVQNFYTLVDEKYQKLPSGSYGYIDDKGTLHFDITKFIEQHKKEYSESSIQDIWEKHIKFMITINCRRRDIPELKKVVLYGDPAPDGFATELTSEIGIRSVSINSKQFIAQTEQMDQVIPVRLGAADEEVAGEGAVDEAVLETGERESSAAAAEPQSPRTPRAGSIQVERKADSDNNALSDIERNDASAGRAATVRRNFGELRGELSITAGPPGAQPGVFPLRRASTPSRDTQPREDTPPRDKFIDPGDTAEMDHPGTAITSTVFDEITKNAGKTFAESLGCKSEYKDGVISIYEKGRIGKGDKLYDITKSPDGGIVFKAAKSIAAMVKGAHKFALKELKAAEKDGKILTPEERAKILHYDIAVGDPKRIAELLKSMKNPEQNPGDDKITGHLTPEAIKRVEEALAAKESELSAEDKKVLQEAVTSSKRYHGMSGKKPGADADASPGAGADASPGAGADDSTKPSKRRRPSPAGGSDSEEG